jgi:hypothetical protein
MNLFIGLMLTGMLAGLVATLAMVLWRRDGVSWTDVVWAGSTAAAHPGQYVRSERVKVIRFLTFLTASLFLAAALLAVGHALRTLL